MQAPIGSEEDARLVEMVGSKPEPGFSIRDHLQLGRELDLLDFEAAAITAGSKFAYLKRAAALLELALCNWAMVHMHQRGFVPISTPDLVQAAVLEKCGFQPRGSNTQVATPLPVWQMTALGGSSPHAMALQAMLTSSCSDHAGLDLECQGRGEG